MHYELEKRVQAFKEEHGTAPKELILPRDFLERAKDQLRPLIHFIPVEGTPYNSPVYGEILLTEQESFDRRRDELLSQGYETVFEWHGLERTVSVFAEGKIVAQFTGEQDGWLLGQAEAYARSH